MNGRTAYIFEKLNDNNVKETLNKTIKYQYANSKERRHSIIIENDESTFIPLLRKPLAGHSAYTRFFAASTEDQPKFVVKQPKLDRIREDELAAVISTYTVAYKREQEIWNSIYPNQRAELVTEEGIRLILPYLPGEISTISKSDDPLVYCKQVLAIIYAVQKFHQLGWSHDDFSEDNVLIEEKPNGTFEAYLIDFDNVSRRDKNISNCEWITIGSLLYRINSLPIRHYDVNSNNIHLVIKHLLLEIDRLEKLNQHNISALVF